MVWYNTAIAIGIIVFIILVVWSRVMHQTMLDTVMEIKEMLSRAVSGTAEAVKGGAEDVGGLK